MSNYRPHFRNPPMRSPSRDGDAGSRLGGGRRDEYRSQPKSYSHTESSYHGYPSRDSYQPPPPGYDSFRPPQSDFTFRADKPAGIPNSRFDNYRLGPDAGDQRRDNHRSRRPRQNQHRPDRPGGRGVGGPGATNNRTRGRRLAADRPILNATHDSNLELSFVNPATGVTYRALGELSDSDEAEMDISGDESSSGNGSGGPSHKKSRLGSGGSALGNTVPKWSNPDPYTAIPPPDTSQHKKKDVVQLIRKARVHSAAEVKPAISAEAVDFISCNLDESDAESEINLSSFSGLPKAQTSGTQPKITLGVSRDLPELGSGGNPKAIKGAAVPNQILPRTSLPSHPAAIAERPRRVDLTPSQDLGTRKRTHDDTLKLPDHAKLKKPDRKMWGAVTPAWDVVPGQDPCPWVTDHAPTTPNVGVWLHKEIVDFYNYVKPRDFEQKLRQSLVDDLGKQVRRQYRDADVYPFGSFMTGLYLPTGDMDLAFCSDSFIDGKTAVYGAKKHVYKMARFLQSRALDGETEPVARARVPLVKYVDKVTGLKVDVSFENMSGVKAIKTFKVWREQFPAMPVLVTLIKQFLAMRGLNEPVNGGIGGFSVMSLVVSMLQLMPDVQSRSLVPDYHLGQLLLEFFDLYGNKFDYETTAIRLNPPGYVNKNDVNSFIYKNRDRLSIIDPNNPENDIAGGSSNIRIIFNAFSHAHLLLRDRMHVLAQSPDKANASILEVILAGNYSSFEEQREFLRSVYGRNHHSKHSYTKKR